MRLLFAFSGAAALASEMGWSQVLARLLGHGSMAIAVVAATYLGGLAAGAALGGRLARLEGAPSLRLFARLEGAVGLLGLGLILIWPALVSWLPRLGTRLASATPGGLLLKALLAALPLLPLTLLMGTTLPVLVKAFTSLASRTAQVSGRLAGWNAAGGAVGALLSVFVILPVLGTRLLLVSAAATNLLIALLVYRLSWPVTLPVASMEAKAGIGASAPRGLEAVRLVPLLLLAGVAALMGQMAWTRVLTWLLGPSVYVFGMLLAATICGLSVGHFLGASPAGKTGQPLRLYGWIEAVLGLSVLGTVALMPLLPLLLIRLVDWTRHMPRLLQAGQLTLTLLLLLVPTTLMGAAFPVACRILARSHGPGRGVGRCSAFLTLGNVLGALLAGFFLPALLGSRQVLILAGSLYLVAGLAALSLSRRGWPGRGALLLGLAGFSVVFMLPGWDPVLFASGPSFNAPHYMAAAAASGHSLSEVLHQRGAFLFKGEGPDALVTVRELPGGGASLQINGRTEASTGPDLRAQVLAAQLPLLHLDHLDRALVIGLASGVTAGSVLTRKPREVVVAELAPTVVAAARMGAFDAVSGRPLEDGRVRLHLGDARVLLQADPRTYDLIASQPSNPWVPGVAGLYTQEFFQLVRHRLTAAGVFGQWVQAYGLTSTDFRNILRTFSHVFPFCRLYEESLGGGDYFLVGSPSPLERDAAVLLRHMTPAVLADLERVGLHRPGSLLARRVLNAAGVRAVAGQGSLLLDDRLSLAYTTPLTFFNETGSSLWRLLEPHRRPALQGYDLSHLDDARGRTLAAQLLEEDRLRREEGSFLQLLEKGDLETLGQPRLSLALALARTGLTRAAYMQLSQGLERTPGPALLQVLAGDLALRLGETDLAEVHYQTALSRRPDSVAALIGLGLLRLEQGVPHKAEPMFQTALQADPLAARALLGLGTAEMAMGDLAKAAVNLKRAVEQAPEWAQAWSNLGVCLRRLARWDTAEEAYRRAVELDPGLGDAWFNLGVLLEIRHRPSEARETYRRGLHNLPGDPSLASALKRLKTPPREEKRLLPAS